jgi:hypothetical protein
MPADHGLRPDDLQSVQHVRCQPIQPGKYQTVDAGKGQSLLRFTPQHIELMTKRQDLCLQRRSRSEQSDQRQPNRAATISHQPRASPDSTALTSRIEFPTMTTLSLIIRRYRAPATSVSARETFFVASSNCTLRRASRPGTITHKSPSRGESFCAELRDERSLRPDLAFDQQGQFEKPPR